MGAGFCSLYHEIHYIEVRYIKVWVYIVRLERERREETKNILVFTLQWIKEITINTAAVVGHFTCWCCCYAKYTWIQLKNFTSWFSFGIFKFYVSVLQFTYSNPVKVESSWLDPALMNCCFILVNLNFSTLMITYIICICMCVCMSWTTGYAFMENKGIVCFFYFEAYHQP